MKRIPSIELDTPIVPRAIAEAVWEEASLSLDTPLPRRWLRELIDRAHTVYAQNPRVRARIRGQGDGGRDWLWAAARLK
jgi:hypothetical protein